LGIFHKRINAKGAMTTLVVGLGVAFLRIALELAVDHLPKGSVLYTYGNVNFLTFASWFFLFSVVLCIAVSAFTPAPSTAQVQGLTFSTLSEEQKKANRTSYDVWDI